MTSRSSTLNQRETRMLNSTIVVELASEPLPPVSARLCPIPLSQLARDRHPACHVVPYRCLFIEEVCGHAQSARVELGVVGAAAGGVPALLRPEELQLQVRPVVRVGRRHRRPLTLPTHRNGQVPQLAIWRRIAPTAPLINRQMTQIPEYDKPQQLDHR